MVTQQSACSPQEVRPGPTTANDTQYLHVIAFLQETVFFGIDQMVTTNGQNPA
jgi:hypothetical protein